MPEFEEKIVDGRFLGLSERSGLLSFIDNKLAVDIKTVDVRDFHKYMLAGYALATEAELEVLMNYSRYIILGS